MTRAGEGVRLDRARDRAARVLLAQALLTGRERRRLQVFCSLAGRCLLESLGAAETGKRQTLMPIEA